jgi:hypothetical protein
VQLSGGIFGAVADSRALFATFDKIAALDAKNKTNE